MKRRSVGFVCMLGMVLFLASCGAGPKPEDTVAQYFNAAQVFDWEQMAGCTVDGKNLLDYADLDVEEKDQYLLDFFKQNASKLSYTVEKSEIVDDTATVTLDCKFIDCTSLMQEVIGEAFAQALSSAFTENGESSNEIFARVFEEKAKTFEDTYTERTITVTCVKSDDAWLIKEVTDDMIDVITGNFVTVAKNISSDFNTESNDANTDADTDANTDAAADTDTATNTNTNTDADADADTVEP